MPTDYRWVGQTELWLPLAMSSSRPGPREERVLWTVGRLAPGVSAEQARAELLGIQQGLERSYPDDYESQGGWSLRLIPVDEEALGRIRPAILLLVAAVGIVLLLVCVNLANLFLVRVEQRWRELALRNALGAGRRRLATELLGETFVLALAGTAVALVLLAWVVDGIATLQPGNVQDEATVRRTRQIVRELDASLPLANLRTLEEHLADSLTHYRLSATLVSLFALVALALAFLGIYGVMSYLTRQRRVEIGIRMALGAPRGQVVRMVVGQALAIAVFGTAIGYLGAFAATQAFRSLLFGIRTTDTGTYAATALLVTGIVLLAGYVPAKKASQIDPARVLTSQ